MDPNAIVNPQVEEYKSYAGIKMGSATRAYFFGIKKEQDVKFGDIVVVETVRGVELGEVTVAPMDIATYKSDLALKPILRVATPLDIKINEQNKKDALLALAICQKEVENLKLNMNLLSCEYTLDRSKILFSTC